MLNMVPVICERSSHCTVVVNETIDVRCKRDRCAAQLNRHFWCTFDRHGTAWERMKAWSVTLKKHQRDNVTSRVARRWVERSGAVIPCVFVLLLPLYYPLPLFGPPPGTAQPPARQFFAMNTFTDPLLSLWVMMDEDCKKTLSHSAPMLSAWPTLATRNMTIFCILMGF